MRASEQALPGLFVRHYADDASEREKFQLRDGVLYPRCATLGGYTAHSAMIVIYPHSSDWDHRPTHRRFVWAADNMRPISSSWRCEYVSAPMRAAWPGLAYHQCRRSDIDGAR
jgi:hypothetical protein